MSRCEASSHSQGQPLIHSTQQQVTQHFLQKPASRDDAKTCEEEGEDESASLLLCPKEVGVLSAVPDKKIVLSFVSAKPAAPGFTALMSQDAEVGPEEGALDEEGVVGDHQHQSQEHKERSASFHKSRSMSMILPSLAPRRPPMNQEEFDERFHYNRPPSPRPGHSLLEKCFLNYRRPFTSYSAFTQAVLGFIPLISWLPTYSWRENLLADVVGGLTVGVMHVPQGIAYALLAGVDPVVGLYTSFFPPLFYMMFGTSRHNSIGSFAVVALMSGMAVQQLRHEIGDGPSAVTVSSTLCLCVGLVHLAMGALRLELVTTYLSDQLVAGFTTAASLHVFVAQLKDLLGLTTPLPSPPPTGAGLLFLRIYAIFERLPSANPATLCLSAVSLAFLLAGKEWLQPWLRRLFPSYLTVPLPFELVLVCLTTGMASLTHLHSAYGVAIVERIPTGMPQPLWPEWQLIPRLLPDALGIAVVVVAVHVSLAKMFAKKLGYKVDVGQEFYALGFSSTLSAFFPVYPVSCSLGRTMVNVEAGTKTQLSTLFCSMLLGAIILYLAQWLRTLPMCVLSAIIIVALSGMLRKFKDLVTLWPLSKIDFSIWLVSFVSTVAWDVIQGLAVSIAYALLTTVFRTQWPRWHLLANLAGTNDFRDAERYDQVTQLPGICIFRFDSPLLFTNVERFKAAILKAYMQWEGPSPRAYLTHLDLTPNGVDTSKTHDFPELDHLNEVLQQRSVHQQQLEQEKEQHQKSVSPTLPTRLPQKRASISASTQGLLYRHFVIDCSGFTFVDYMGANALKEVFTEMRRDRLVLVYFAAAKAPVRDLFEKSGFYSYVPKSNFYPTIRDAVAIARRRRNASTLHLLDELSLPYEALEDAISAQPMN